MFEGLDGELVGIEKLRIRPEAHRRAGTPGRNIAHRLQLRSDFAVIEADVVLLATAPDGRVELLRQRVDNGYTYAMETAGEFVVIGRKFTARVQAGHDQLNATDLFLGMDINWHPAAIVDHFQRSILEQGDFDLLGMPFEGLVDTVVDDLVRQMVGARGVRIHARTAAYGFESTQDFNIGCVV